jgi:hypothetical protein
MDSQSLMPWEQRYQCASCFKFFKSMEFAMGHICLQKVLLCLSEIESCRDWGKMPADGYGLWFPLTTELDWAEELHILLKTRLINRLDFGIQYD